VRSLPLPDRTQARDQLMTAIEVYERNGVERGYAATPAEIDAVLAIYDDYDAALGAGSAALKGLALTQDLRTAVHDGYDFTQAGRKLSAIRIRLLQGVEQCPICGISPPRELDHHLPRSAFHPLAVYVRNLVPLCHDCNHSKSRAVPAEAARRFVQPYLEPLPPIRFLRAVVSLDHGALVARFEIDPAAALPGLLRQRLAYQVERLKLNERYGREINAYLTGHTVAIHTAHATGGAEGVRRFLRQQAEVEFQVFHRNHWRPVLLVALADDDGFCDGGFQAVLPLLLPLPAQA
jgi:hypothetical protein